MYPQIGKKMSTQSIYYRSIKPSWLAATLFILTACSGPTQKPATTEPLDPLNNQALADFKSGNIETAAETWALLANQATNPNRSYYLLRAADARIMLAQLQQADSLLAEVAPSQLDNRYRALYKVVKAELLLAAGEPQPAESLLLTTSSRNPQLQQRIQLLLDKARREQQSPTQQAWAEFTQQANSSLMNDSYALDLMHSLDPIPVAELEEKMPQLTGQLPGWVDLVLIARSQHPDIEARNTAISNWRSRNPSHRLTVEQAYRLSEDFSSSLPAPARVSIVLPQSGRMAGMAAAIRDGMMASYLNSPQKNQTELRFLSSTGAGLNGETFAASVANLATTADQIIGPLSRSKVVELMAVKPSALPLLALNLPPQQVAGEPELRSETVFFPLLPEDEARAAANRAIASGFMKMIVLTPTSKMGERLANAFVETYILAGGSIIGSNSYQQTDVDHSDHLKQLLGVTNSQLRAKRMQQILGAKIGFETSVRGDIDAIFLVANPLQGRLIKPQLKFLDAGHIPVLATSMIYSGNPDWRADRDLNGIAITTNYIAIRRSEASKDNSSSLPQSLAKNGKLDRFFALGADSWSILPWLPAMQENPQMTYSGLSGQLSITASGRLAREPVWAVFRKGLLQQLAATPLE